MLNILDKFFRFKVLGGVPVLLAALAGDTSGQTNRVQFSPDRGLLPTATYATGDPDTINVVNGSLQLKIPIAAFPKRRGGDFFQLDLLYDSGIYDVVAERADTPDSPPLSVISTKLTRSGSSGGWRYNFQNLQLLMRERKLTTSCQGDTNAIAQSERLHGVSIGLLDGATHALTPLGFGDEILDGHIDDGFYGISAAGGMFNCAGSTHYVDTTPQTHIYYYTTDSTFIQVHVDNSGVPWAPGLQTWTARFPDGRRIENPSRGLFYLYDANENYIRISNVCLNSDCTTALQTTIWNGDNDGIGVEFSAEPGRDKITQVAPNNTIATTWVTWHTVEPPERTYVCADAPQPPPGQSSSPTYCLFNSSLWVIQSITKPDIAKPIEFGYDVSANGWGELNAMSNPFVLQKADGTVASIAWDWQGRFTDSASAILRNRVIERRLYHDGQAGPDKWLYSYTNTTTTLTSPDGGIEVYSYYDPTKLGDWNRGLVHRIEHSNGDVTERTWRQSPTVSLATRSSGHNPNNPYVEAELRLPAGATPATKGAKTLISRDQNGNVVSVADFDFGASAASRTVSSTYYNSTGLAGTPPSPTDQHNYTFPAATGARKLDAVRRVSAGGATVEAVTEYLYDDPATRGNVVEERTWDNTLASAPSDPLTAGQYLSKTWTHNTRGDVTSANGDQLHVRYDYLPVCGGRLLLDRTTIGFTDDVIARHFTKVWDCITGYLSYEGESQNNAYVQYSYDNIGRLQGVFDRNGEVQRSTYTFHNLSQGKISQQSDVKAVYDGLGQTTTHLDHLGRVRLVRRSDGSALSATGESDGILTQTIRKVIAGGHVEIRSNPYRTVSDATMGWVCDQYDTAGRRVRTSWYSGSTAPSLCTDGTNRTGEATTIYSFDNTLNRAKATHTDAAGHVREEYFDGLGRLRRVVEDPGTGSTKKNYETTYSYDGRGNLMFVVQGTQGRTFIYDSVGRLTSATNPENGTVTYAYYPNGLLKSRTDSRTPNPVTVGYTYDALHRITSKTYNNVPAVSYTYHTTANSVTPNIGKLRSVTNGAASIFYDAYDRLGRVSISRQIIGTRELRFSYGYALNDALTGIIYPSGRVLAFSLDDAGRTTGATGGMPGSTAVSYASGATYAPHGALSQMTLNNGLTERWKYTPRLQVSNVLLGTGADGTPAAYNRMGLSYGYGADGSPSAHGIQRPEGTWSQGFSYDAVGRLQSAWETAGPEVWRQSFDYDRWGNRWFNSACVGVATCNHGFFQDPLSASAQGDYNQATNRLTKTGLTEYADGVGNQTKLGELVLTYDEEGRVATSAIGNTSSAYHTSSTYQYDGEGRRVRKVVEKTVNNTTTTDTTVYVYTAHGELAAEYKGEPQQAEPVRYVAVDALGSTRALTDGAGAVTKCYDYLPFGEPVTGRSGCYAGPDEASQKFTGHERNRETSTVDGNDRDALDYFGARYFSGVQGRFTSPDEPLADQSAGDPQSWNLYGYVRNSPLRFTDPTGEACQDGADEKGNPCFSIDVTDKLGTRAKRAVGAAANSVNGLIGLANFVIITVGPRTMDPNVERSRQIPYLDIQDRSGNVKFGEQTAQLASVPFILTGAAIGELLKAAAKIDRNLLTKAGRALQKHGSRPGSAFPAAQGSAGTMNQQAAQVLQSILESPQASTAVRHHARFGNVLEVTVPNGQGARFSADGKEFIGFIEK